jgi:hypothetical protein
MLPKKYDLKVLVSKFHFCFWIGLNQITLESKEVEIYTMQCFYPKKNNTNAKFIPLKMANVKPQPFSIQIKNKKK